MQFEKDFYGSGEPMYLTLRSTNAIYKIPLQFNINNNI